MMNFEQVIMYRHEIIKEETIKQFYLTSYQQTSKDAIPAKYRRIFIDYQVSFKDGIISLLSNVLETFNTIHRIGLGITTGIQEINVVGIKRSYFFKDNTLYFISDNLLFCKSWSMTFDGMIDNITIFNGDTVFLDMCFYAVINDDKIEIDDNKIKGKPETQPLIKSEIVFENDATRMIIALMYNRQSIFHDQQKRNRGCKSC